MHDNYSVMTTVDFSVMELWIMNCIALSLSIFNLLQYFMYNTILEVNSHAAYSLLKIIIWVLKGHLCVFIFYHYNRTAFAKSQYIILSIY